METKEEVKDKTECHHGVPMSDEELEEYRKSFADIEECFAGLKEDNDQV